MERYRVSSMFYKILLRYPKLVGPPCIGNEAGEDSWHVIAFHSPIIFHASKMTCSLELARAAAGNDGGGKGKAAAWR